MHASRVVVADTFAFSRQATHNRARIRTATGSQWLTVPRQHAPVGTPLLAVGVVGDGWPRRHRHALRTAYGMAPFYEHLAPEIDALLAEPHTSIGALATATTRWTLRHLGVTVPVAVASEVPDAPSTLVDVWRAVGGGIFLSRPDAAERDRAILAPVDGTVAVARLDPAAAYRQTFPGFVGGLSALDLLMNHGPASAEWLRAACDLAPVPPDDDAPR